jgi:hypothetical protein
LAAGRSPSSRRPRPTSRSRTTLAPYHPNIQKRLTKSPKIYIRDTGLLHSLAGLDRPEALESWHVPLIGADALEHAIYADRLVATRPLITL